MQFIDKPCNEFVEVLSSKAAVPGGGGACALVGAVGIALGAMVGNLTVGKKKQIITSQRWIKATFKKIQKEIMVRKNCSCNYNVNMI